MTKKTIINTNKAPQAIGTYSQAIKIHDTVYLSGQIPLVPSTMELISSDIREQITQVFNNLSEVCDAAGGSLADIVKLNIFLTDLVHFPVVNEIMGEVFTQPFPARAALGINALPRGAQVEMDAVMVL